MPTVTVVAADATGAIVRYYESGETAPYFGATVARSAETGLYDPTRDPRMIASTGKMLAAIAIANSGRDSAASLYVDDRSTRAWPRDVREGQWPITAAAPSWPSPVLSMRRS